MPADTNLRYKLKKAINFPNLKNMKTEKQNRREFLQLSAAGVAALSVMKNADVKDLFKSDTNEELLEITVSELQAKM